MGVLVGVVSRRWVWLVVRRYIDILTIIINFPYSTFILALFWQQHPYFFVHFKNVFSVLFLLFFFNIYKRYSKNIQDGSKKSSSREYNYLIITRSTHAHHASRQTLEKQHEQSCNTKGS